MIEILDELIPIAKSTYLSYKAGNTDRPMLAKRSTRDLGFTAADRVENIRRVAEVARLMADAGLIVLVSFISPFRAERQRARERLGDAAFLEIFVDTPLAECERRDPKGLYAKARAGRLVNFTGIDSPYEPPAAPDLHLRTTELPVEREIDLVVDALRQRGIFD